MEKPTRRAILMAALLGVLIGAAMGAYTRFLRQPIGFGGGFRAEPGLIAIGSPEGGGGWITLYRGLDEEPVARVRVPWEDYNEAVGLARPVPMRLRSGASQQIVVALGAWGHEPGGWLIVLDGPENGCKTLAWKRVVLGDTEVPQPLWIAGGDVDGDGLDEIVAGSTGAGGLVVVLDDLAHGLAPLGTLSLPWKEYNSVCGETRPGVGDLDRDGKAEIVVGLAAWRKRGGWAAVYSGLRFSKWVRFPESEYCANGGGTWPAVMPVEGGKANLLLGTDRGPFASIAAIEDSLGAPKSSWIPIPGDVTRRTVELRPVCADLLGDGWSRIVAHLPGEREECAAALFDDAAHAHDFLGWRFAASPGDEPPPDEPIVSDPGASSREAALAALAARRGELDVSTDPEAGVSMLFGTLSDPSALPPIDRANEFLREHGAIWGIADPERDLALDRDDSILAPDDCNTTHVMYDQAVSGVPLLAHGLGVHIDRSGVVTAVTGEFDPVAAVQSLNSTPAIAKEAAIQTVRGDFETEFLVPPQARLVAWREQGPVRLCWAVEVSSVVGGYQYLVDAQDGCVLSAHDMTSYSDPVPTKALAQSAQENMVELDVARVDLPPVAFWVPPIFETRRSALFMWRDMTHRAEISSGFRLVGDTASGPGTTPEETHEWIDGASGAVEGPPFRWEGWVAPDPTVDRDYGIRDAASAHWLMHRVLRYWASRRGRESYDNAHADLFVLADRHTRHPRRNQLMYQGNAVWVGRGICIGPPDRARNTMAVLDILGHEFAHGVVNSTDHLWWRTGGTTRAIDEHVPDFFGICAEHYENGEMAEFQPGRVERDHLWKLGEETGMALRDFTVSWDYDTHLKNPYQNDEAHDWGNCHDNARILGHWSYLWLHGGTHTWRDASGRNNSVWPRGMTDGWNAGTEEAMRVAQQAYWRFLLYTRHVNYLTFEDFRRRMLQCILDSGSATGYRAAVEAFQAIHLWPPYRLRFEWALNLQIGDRLREASQTFRWSPVRGANQYMLSIGSRPGGRDVFHADLGRGVSVSATGLPTDGRTLYIRLWFKKDGAWYYQDSLVMASGGDGTGPAITSPAPGSALTAEAATFTWSGGTDVSSYRLKVGTTPGGADIADLSLGIATSALVHGLPTDGRSVFVELWYRRGSVLRHSDAMYRSAGVVEQAGEPPIAQIISPGPGSTLDSGTVEFRWSPGVNVSAYKLQIGSARGGTDVYNRTQGRNLRAVVENLPEDGRVLHVRIWSQLPAGWVSWDSSYTANTRAGSAPPTFWSPVADAVIYWSTMMFAWYPGDATQFWLKIGTTPGGTDLFDRNLGEEYAVEVDGLPTDGRMIYARLWYRATSQWRYVETRHATAPYGTPALVSPAPDSQLSTFYARFAWAGGVNIRGYRFWLGSTPRGSDLAREVVGAENSITLRELPTDGRTLYARLWFETEFGWRYVDARYRAAATGERPPAITDPPPGSTLPSSSATFAWIAGPAVGDCRLHLSQRPPIPFGTGDSWGIGALPDPGRNRSLSVTHLPTDHGPVYAWLTWRDPAGQLGEFRTPFVAYYAAHPDTRTPAFTSPSPGSTWTSSTVRFDWSSPPGTRDTWYRSYWFQVPDAVGHNLTIGATSMDDDIFDMGGSTNSASWTVILLPTDGRRVYARLDGGSPADGWPSEVVEFSTGGSGPTAWTDGPTLTSPLPGATLPSAATFTWSPASDVGDDFIHYYVSVGSIAGARDIFEKDAVRELSVAVTALPSDGRLVYFRLYYWTGARWRNVDYTFTASGGQVTPVFLDPAGGSTLTSSIARFTWSPSTGASQYRLQVGRTPGGSEFYDAYEGMSLSATVTGLPQDGSMLAVRLSYMRGGAWSHVDTQCIAASGGARTNGPVWSWGNGHDGQIGYGGHADRDFPVSVMHLDGVDSILAGRRYSLALKGDGTVWSWGTLYGSYNNRYRWMCHAPEPVVVPILEGVSAIAAGPSHALALKSDRTVWAWGCSSGLGRSIVTGGDDPARVDGIDGVIGIAAGKDHSLALKADGTVWAWGVDDEAQLGGHPGVSSSHTPLQVPVLSGVTRVSAGFDHSIALKDDGTVWAWGVGRRGQLGPDGVNLGGSSPVQVTGLPPITAISDGYRHCLALDAGGRIWAWGDNIYGQLGLEGAEMSATPVQVEGIEDVVAIAAGYYVSLALRSDGTVWAWGNNQYGQLGNDTGASSHVPVQIQGLQGITHIATGGWHLLAMSRR